MLPPFCLAARLRSAALPHVRQAFPPCLLTYLVPSVTYASDVCTAAQHLASHLFLCCVGAECVGLALRQPACLPYLAYMYKSVCECRALSSLGRPSFFFWKLANDHTSSPHGHSPCQCHRDCLRQSTMSPLQDMGLQPRALLGSEPPTHRASVILEGWAEGFRLVSNDAFFKTPGSKSIH